tara:strand:+ start:85 stop:744 length:660 start_codon:yes stop_codon:yes gene_type:complete
MRTIRRYQNGGKNGGESEDTTRRVLDRYLDKRSTDELLDDLYFYRTSRLDSRKRLMDLIEFASRDRELEGVKFAGEPKLDMIKGFNKLMKSGSAKDPHDILGVTNRDLYYFPPHKYYEDYNPFGTVGDYGYFDEEKYGEKPKNYPLIPEEQYMPSIMPKQIPTGVKKPDLQIPESSPHYLPKGAWRKPHYKYNRDGKGTQDGWIVYQRGKSPKIKYFNN